jgi:hypothetical protein
LIVERVAELDVAAASGVAIVGDTLHVVADDEPFVARYGLGGAPRGRVALFDDALPEEPAARKAAKPDLEVLFALPGGVLVALGSGSRPTRRRGARLDGDTVTPLELAPLYERLLGELPELNVEGVAVCGERLRLLSRGNGPGRVNAVIDVALREVAGARVWPASALRAVRRVTLPTGFGFTDAEPLGGGALLFTAAAEDSASTYEDGAVAGSILGVLDGVVVREVRPLSALKVEGVARRDAELYLVTDADDRATRAALLRTRWS